MCLLILRLKAAVVFSHVKLHQGDARVRHIEHRSAEATAFMKNGICHFYGPVIFLFLDLPNLVMILINLLPGTNYNNFLLFLVRIL